MSIQYFCSELVVAKLVVPELVVPELVVPELVVPEVVVPKLAVPELVLPELAVPKLVAPELREIPRDSEVSCWCALLLVQGPGALGPGGRGPEARGSRARAPRSRGPKVRGPRAQGDSERLKGYTLVRDAATKNIEPLIFMCMCVVCGYREQRIDLRWRALVQSSERFS